jgi:hypothetical protein
LRGDHAQISLSGLNLRERTFQLGERKLLIEKFAEGDAGAMTPGSEACQISC